MQNYDFPKLIPMTSFVIDYYSHEGYADLQTLQLMKNYANFLKQPLALWMFVPTDSKGELLKEPEDYDFWRNVDSKAKKDLTISESSKIVQFKAYEKARKKILFEGFKVGYNGYSVVRIIASYDDSIELSFKKDNFNNQMIDDVESLTKYNEIYLSALSLKSIGINP